MTTINLDLDGLVLAHGVHDERSEGVCLMEAVAWAAGEDHSDMPACVSPVLREFGVTLNDRLGTDERQQLKRFIPDLIGTAGDGHDEQRRAMAREWLMTDALPRWLTLANLPELAEQARAAKDLDGEQLQNALYAIRELTWKARAEWRAKVRDAVKAELAKHNLPVAAVAAVAADAVADAVAAAVAAAADAVAAAVAAAAAAAADAVAVAVAAAAVAVAVAAAVAVAVAAANEPLYGKVYWAVKDKVRELIRTDDRFAAVRDLQDQSLTEGLALYERLIHAGRVA